MSNQVVHVVVLLCNLRTGLCCAQLCGGEKTRRPSLTNVQPPIKYGCFCATSHISVAAQVRGQEGAVHGALPGLALHRVRGHPHQPQVQEPGDPGAGGGRGGGGAPRGLHGHLPGGHPQQDRPAHAVQERAVLPDAGAADAPCARPHLRELRDLAEQGQVLLHGPDPRAVPGPAAAGRPGAGPRRRRRCPPPPDARRAPRHPGGRWQTLDTSSVGRPYHGYCGSLVLCVHRGSVSETSSGQVGLKPLPWLCSDVGGCASCGYHHILLVCQGDIPPGICEA
mmetsp:Transcript_9782/g.15887  ORF Transcript_9782/g.15887 Transcript_9782/m.15887 type:complete len:280 (+) Transcript_9782:372-1211(+)